MEARCSTEDTAQRTGRKQTREEKTHHVHTDTHSACRNRSTPTERDTDLVCVGTPTQTQIYRLVRGLQLCLTFSVLPPADQWMRPNPSKGQEWSCMAHMHAWQHRQQQSGASSSQVWAAARCMHGPNKRSCSIGEH